MVYNPIVKVTPVVFNAPTLGTAVCLGELYDQRKGQFLGVQLYPQDKIQEIVTNIRHTELSLSLSTTHEERASLLDINAKLSLDILSGLVKVSGSAAYLNDSKSNTHEYAYALALKMRLNEKRLRFAEPELGRKILDVAQQDYIGEDKPATHFVSSIVYGGNFIVNLVARKSKLSKEEKIEGKLEASIDKLKGAISLDGSVEAKIKEDVSKLDDKFDLIIHGDVALEKVPINPQDVLDIFPDAASLITDGGGVPISVTLQPIPRALLQQSHVYELKADFLDKVLKAFAKLGDINSRFSVLEDGIKSIQSFVPALARKIREVGAEYATEYGELLHQLGEFLQDYQKEGKMEPDGIFADKTDEEDSADEESSAGGKDSAGGEAPAGKEGSAGGEGPASGEAPAGKERNVFARATELYNKHTDPTREDNPPQQYPPTLVGLENEFSRFKDFVTDIRRVRISLLGRSDATAKALEKSVFLSDIDDVSRAIRLQDNVPLFIMISLRPALPSNSLRKSPSDLVVIRFLAILRKYAAYFNDTANPAHILYAENLQDLQHRLGDPERSLPNGKQFSELESPSFLIGQVDYDGELTWSDPPPTTELALKLHHKPSDQTLGDLSFNVDSVNGTKSFSFQIRGKFGSTQQRGLTICHVECAIANKTPFLRWLTPFTVELKRSPDLRSAAVINSSKTVKPNERFTATFVQDIKDRKWILYLGDEKVNEIPYTSHKELLQDAAKVRLAYPAAGWWDGEIYEVIAFSYALTKDQIVARNAAQNK